MAATAATATGAANQVGQMSLEDTYRVDSDAENDDAEQVGKDIDDFEARLAGVKAETRTAAAKPASKVFARVNLRGAARRGAARSGSFPLTVRRLPRRRRLLDLRSPC